LRRIVKQAKGIPRTINILCDNALVTGFGYRKQPVTAAIVREVIAGLAGQRASRQWKWGVAALATILIIGGLLLANPELPQPLARLPLPPIALSPSAVSVSPPSAPSQTPERSASSLGSPDTARAAEATAAPERSALAEPKAPVRAQNTVVAIRVVKPGDNLSRLAAEVYGISRPEVVGEVVRNNPGIENPDLLPVGMRIRFPRVAPKGVVP
jgi:general secretion pathway protein A